MAILSIHPTVLLSLFLVGALTGRKFVDAINFASDSGFVEKGETDGCAGTEDNDDGTTITVFMGIEDLSEDYRECMYSSSSGSGSSSGVVSDSYHCTEDPLKTRRKFDEGRVTGFDDFYDMGVVQLVEGTEAEQAAIHDVVLKMVDYFYREVMTKPVYEGIRHHCVNHFELCAFWATLGECETNRQFMIPQCPAACRFCLLHEGEYM